MSTLRPVEDPVMDEFSQETRMLLLNFLSLLPLDGQSSSGSGSLASSGSLERNKKALDAMVSSESPQEPAGRDRTSVDGGLSWQQTLPSLPEVSLVDRIIGRTRNLEIDGEDSADAPVPTPRGNLYRHASLDITNTDSAPPPLPSRESPQRRSMPVQRSMDRQTSNTSASSDGTDMSDVSSLMMSSRSTTSHRSNYVDIQYQEVEPLIRQGVLPPQALPLKEQLNREMDELTKQNFTKGKSPSPHPRGHPPTPNPTGVPFPGPSPRVSPDPSAPPHTTTPGGTTLSSSVSVMTPQSEVAEHLRNIGDSVHKMYGRQFETAFGKAMSQSGPRLDYAFVELILTQLTENIPSVAQRVALVMLLSQRLAMCGKDVSSLINFTVQYITNSMAGYIVSQGGWNSILSLDDPLTPGEIEVTVPVTTDLDNLPLPGPIHTVSTSTTLVGEDTLDAAQTVSEDHTRTFSEDPLDSAPSDSGIATAPLPRDTTMNSIASLPASEVATPVGDSATAAAESEVEKVRPEIALLRQYSDAAAAANHHNGADAQLTDQLTTAGLVTLGVALSCCTVYMVYKRVSK